ncbi:hypothetical protein [Spirosoma daeguense]
MSYWLSGLGIITDQSRFGDLYQFSALPQFKQKWPVYPTSHRSNDTASTHLYIIGDSFTHPLFLSQSDFRVSHYERWDQGAPAQCKLDSTKRNVLLIESVERNVRQNFAIKSTQTLPTITYKSENWITKLSKRFDRNFHRSRIESRLESALFNHDWAFCFKEIKAALTLNWFNRTDIQVTLSTDQQHLFYFMDTDKRLPLNSSFAPISDSEIDSLIFTINATSEHYRRLGFDEIFLSIIPNKASILDTNRTDYNHLIERIQESPKLKIPIINTYAAYRQSTISPYLKGDTHWNCEGREIWLKLIWEKLRI